MLNHLTLAHFLFHSSIELSMFFIKGEEIFMIDDK